MHNSASGVGTNSTKIPPVPPPKPKNYLLQYPNGQIVKFGQFSRSTVGGQLPPPPGDSDTDSGICADSDNQLSPRHINATGYLDDRSKILQRKIEIPVYREHLTPESAWRLCVNLPNAVSRCQKRFPQKPQISSNSQTSRTGKHFRVRFADQVSSTDGDSPSSSCWDNNDLGSKGCDSHLGYYFRHSVPTTTAAPTTECSSGSSSVTCDQKRLPLGSTEQNPTDNQFTSGYRAHQTVDVDALPDPSPYSVAATTRLRRTDDRRITRSCEPPRVIRRYHNRSASLPRGMHHHFAYLEDRRGSIDCCPPQDYPRYIDDNERPIKAHLMRSVDNLHVTDGGSGTLFNDMGARPGTGRRLPELPPEGVSFDPSVRQPAFSRQRRVRKPATSLRSQSVDRPSHTMDSTTANAYMSCFVPALYRPHMPSVRAQLVALDHRGFRTVLIEKLQPGPFGFYIATGVLNQKRGIFISRISLPSLAPVLSVGDEIIFVEDEVVKGQDLEYVQTLIAGKSSVKIVLLPTVGAVA